MTDHRVDLGAAPHLIRTRELAADGWSWRDIRTATEAGILIKLRNGAYCAADTSAACVEAGSLRGRLTCLSELRRRGVFVRDRTALHVHIVSTAARLPTAPSDARVHRVALRRTPDPAALSVEPLDAVAHAVLCQRPRDAVATIDSALHHGVLRLDELDELFGALPRRYRRLRGLLDARAESGPETLVRLILRTLGCRFDVQAHVDGVGRVDLLVDGWLIVECDSEQFHSGWQAQRADRRRDLAAASRGYSVLRIIAEDIMWRPEAVQAALRGLIGSPRSRPRPRVARAG